MRYTTKITRFIPGVVFIFIGYDKMLYNEFFGCISYLTNSCAQNSLARVSREGEKISSTCATLVAVK